MKPDNVNQNNEISDVCINYNLSKAVWQAGCKAALIAKDKSCRLSGYLSSKPVGDTRITSEDL